MPHNYILLALFTIFEGYTLSIVGFYQTKVILSAAILTLVITVALTVYAFTTDSDITLQGSLLFILAAAFMGMMLVGIFVKARWYVILVSGFGSVLYGFFIVYDTQLILGTKAAQFSIDDYILASFTLYIDIVGLFLQLLELIQALTSNSD